MQVIKGPCFRGALLSLQNWELSGLPNMQTQNGNVSASQLPKSQLLPPVGGFKSQFSIANHSSTRCVLALHPLNRKAHCVKRCSHSLSVLNRCCVFKAQQQLVELNCKLHGLRNHRVLLASGQRVEAQRGKSSENFSALL